MFFDKKVSVKQIKKQEGVQLWVNIEGKKSPFIRFVGWDNGGYKDKKKSNYSLFLDKLSQQKSLKKLNKLLVKNGESKIDL